MNDELRAVQAATERIIGRARLGREMAALLRGHLARAERCLGCRVTWNMLEQRFTHEDACTVAAWNRLGPCEPDENTVRDWLWPTATPGASGEE